MLGASGGAGGCGGSGAKGGRPGASAIGMVFSSNADSAKTDVDIENAKFKINAGNGGVGGSGSSGQTGSAGGSAIQFQGPISYKFQSGNPYAWNHVWEGTQGLDPKGIKGQDGYGGFGGAGSSGAQGGYAMGVIIDCDSVNTHNYPECSGKINLKLPANLNIKLRTKHGKHGFDKNSQASDGSYCIKSQGGPGGKGTQNLAGPQEAEFINNETALRGVKSNEPISFIYKKSGNKAELGSKYKNK